MGEKQTARASPCWPANALPIAGCQTYKNRCWGLVDEEGVKFHLRESDCVFAYRSLLRRRNAGEREASDNQERVSDRNEVVNDAVNADDNL